jgi:3-methyladenine DNA glycosylase Tag
LSPERSWVYKNRSKPTKDSQFLESMTRVVFQAGLNWKMMDKKWPAFQEAFASFDVEKVASFEEEDIDRLLNDKSIVRNSQKIHATVKNA